MLPDISVLYWHHGQNGAPAASRPARVGSAWPVRVAAADMDNPFDCRRLARPPLTCPHPACPPSPPTDPTTAPPKNIIWPDRKHFVPLHRRFPHSRSPLESDGTCGRERQDIIKETCNSVYLRRVESRKFNVSVAIAQCSMSHGLAYNGLIVYHQRGLRHCLFFTNRQCESLTRGISKVADSRASFLCACL